MIDHLSLGTHRYADAIGFYRCMLAPLGLGLLRDTGAEAAFGTPEHWCFFLYPVAAEEPVTPRGAHVAFAAPDREAVAAAHALALAAGASDIFTPRTRPDISDSYFGAMFHDLDGHRIEVLTNAR
jgi:catechol 2,3-dioxygenase-like lactoylglutathione lyase family enzyme